MIPGLVGAADGTLFSLAFEPTLEDSVDFNGRKLLYTLTVLIINNLFRTLMFFSKITRICIFE